MGLNKVIIAVAGILILSGPAQSINVPSMGLIQRGFKSCTDNCKVDACKSQENRTWCEAKCSHKINMNKVCYNPNKPLSAQEEKLLNNLGKYNPHKPLSTQEQKLLSHLKNSSKSNNVGAMAPTDMPQALPQ